MTDKEKLEELVTLAEREILFALNAAEDLDQRKCPNAAMFWQGRSKAWVDIKLALEDMIEEEEE